MKRSKFSSPKQKRHKTRARHSKQSQTRASGSRFQTIGATVEARSGVGSKGVESQKAPRRVISASRGAGAGAKEGPGSDKAPGIPVCVGTGWVIWKTGPKQLRGFLFFKIRRPQPLSPKLWMRRGESPEWAQAKIPQGPVTRPREGGRRSP